jgi:hypothetical protein
MPEAIQTSSIALTRFESLAMLPEGIERADQCVIAYVTMLMPIGYDCFSEKSRK